MKDTVKITTLRMTVICLAFFTSLLYAQQITRMNDIERLTALCKEHQIDASNIKTSYDKKGYLSKLKINAKHLDDIDLSDFKRLKKVIINKTLIRNVTSLKLPPSISFLDLRDNLQLEEIELEDFAHLETILLNNCDLRSLSLTNLPKLAKLDVYSNYHLEEIDLSDFPGIELSFLEKDTFLARIRLHESNQYEFGTTLIEYDRDDEGQILFEGHYDKRGNFVKVGSGNSRKSYQGSDLRKEKLKKKDQPINGDRSDSLWENLKNLCLALSIVLLVVLFYLYPRYKTARWFLYYTGVGVLFAFILFKLLFYISLRFRYFFFSFSMKRLTEKATLNQSETMEQDKQFCVRDKSKNEISMEKIEGAILLKGFKNDSNSLYMKQLVKEYINQSRQTKIIPVYLPAEDCSEGVIKAILKMLKKDKTIFGKKDIEIMIEKKSFAIFIDGYNKLKKGKDKKVILDFIEEFDPCIVLISIGRAAINRFPSKKVKVYEISQAHAPLN